MSNPILSICIPTYNRAEFLRQNLNSIVVQFKDSEVLAQTEIVISDNGSSDNTQEVVQEFCGRFANIQYFKNQENIGFDRNVLQVVEKSSGEYCWLLGDDDALFDGGIKVVLDEIFSSKAPYFMANCQGFDHELANPALDHPNLPFKENQYFRQLADFVRGIKNYQDLVGNFGGMSSQIFSRRAWKSLPDAQKYIGSQTIHLHILLIVMKNLPFVILAKPLVKTRSDNMRWDSFPGLETIQKRQEQTKKGLFWIMNLYEIPSSRIAVNWFFFKQRVNGTIVHFFKKFIFTNPKTKLWASKIYKKLLRK